MAAAGAFAGLGGGGGGEECQQVVFFGQQGGEGFVFVGAEVACGVVEVGAGRIAVGFDGEVHLELDEVV